MPVYEYRCRQCGEVFSHRFGTLRAAAEGEAPPCPACGAGEAQRLISSVAVLAGGGGGGIEEAPAPRTSQVFGRKELNKALKERGS